MVKTRTAYICNYCQTAFWYETEARRCEQRHIDEKRKKDKINKYEEVRYEYRKPKNTSLKISDYVP